MNNKNVFIKIYNKQFFSKYFEPCKELFENPWENWKRVEKFGEAARVEQMSQTLFSFLADVSKGVALLLQDYLFQLADCPRA